MPDLGLQRRGGGFVMLASQTTIVTNTGTTAVVLPHIPRGLLFLLDVTAQATENADTLDVQVQTQIGTSGTWTDIVAFPQVLGGGASTNYVSDLVPAHPISQQQFIANATLATNLVRNVLGDAYRVRWTIVDDGADNASFTFSVEAHIF